MINEENVLNYPNGIETRVALLEMSIANINQTLVRLESKMDKQVEEIKSEIRTEIKSVREDMTDIRRDMKSDFRWILTIIAALGGIMAHGFHWF